MRSLIVGSHALKALGVCNREPKDLDWWNDMVSQQWSLAPNVDHLWHPSFAEFIPETETPQYATLDQMYTIKLSHSHWELPNGSWHKHIYDLIKLQDAGGQLDLDLYKILYKVWEQMHGKKVMNLAQDKTEFFDDAVRRMFDHDSLHESVAFGERPVYEEILKDGATVDVDSDKLWALPRQRIVQLFVEEICVTALERKVIPSNYSCSPGAAYLWALRRTITSLTKGKSSRFILENIKEFITPDPEYVRRHLSKADRLVRL
jgi:hypothetical protein